MYKYAGRQAGGQGYTGWLRDCHRVDIVATAVHVEFQNHSDHSDHSDHTVKGTMP